MYTTKIKMTESIKVNNRGKDDQTSRRIPQKQLSDAVRYNLNNKYQR